MPPLTRSKRVHQRVKQLDLKAKTKWFLLGDALIRWQCLGASCQNISMDTVSDFVYVPLLDWHVWLLDHWGSLYFFDETTLRHGHLESEPSMLLGLITR